MNEASHSLDRLAAATDRVLATATALSDAQAREPSLLPGWTRGHLLTHIARNADGMVNLLRWAGRRLDGPGPRAERANGAALTLAGGGSLPELPPWR
jgi:maleylpyruvate isomerase